MFETFATMLDAAGGRTIAASSLNDIIGLVRETPGNEAWVSDQVTEAFPTLADELRDAGVKHRTPAEPGAVRDTPLGITAARLAIAETGSVLLHENDLPGRAVSLMTQRLIVLCPTSALVPSLDEAAPVLRAIAASGPSYATFVTGPSRTADIERELAVGVQGPGEMVVVFVAATLSGSGRH